MTWRRLAIDLFLMAAIGVAFGLAAPFGSAAMPAGPRLAFWVFFIVAGYALFRPVSAVAGWVAEETRVPPWLSVLLTALVASLPLAALIGFALGGMAVDSGWFGERFALLYAQVAFVGVAIHLLMLFLYRTPAAAPPEAPGPAAAPAPAPTEAADSPFLRRLPPALGRDLLCLEMQDHYVRAETRLGSTLLLMRFRDAVAELGAAGLQVHRSWWVAASAMEALEREGRSARLRLVGGATVPVSRAYLPAVREALAGRFDRPRPAGKSRAGDVPQGRQGIEP
jgi:hypothetical protein